jgi:hypothetical protein
VLWAFCPVGACWFCRCVLAIQLSACADAIHQESPAVGYPPYVCRHVLAFSSNLCGSITHRGGRDARVPVRAASRQLSATPTGTVWNINAFHAPNCRRVRRRNRPAVGCPPYVCRHVLAFSSNFFGAITHRGGRDARVIPHKFFCVGYGMVGNRPLGGCVFGERSKTKTEGTENVSVKPKHPKRRVCWFCRCVNRPRCRRVRRRNRPAVGYPPYVYQHVLAFSSNLFGSITHRGGRDARVPVRAASRQLSACADAIHQESLVVCCLSWRFLG